MVWKSLILAAGAIYIVFLEFSGCSTTVDQGRVFQKYLQWNYTFFNERCVSADDGRNPCMDIRVCNFAVASLAMGGWPTLCGWVGNKVPKVCCGLPLVLGPSLMKRVDEEKARKRECGRTTFSGNLSETENAFFRLLRSLPEVDTREPNKFDPPLDLTVEHIISPVGGAVSRQGDFPWMVSIRKHGQHMCGGSLIDRRHILSAAHCYVEFGGKLNPETYAVHVGNIKVNEGYPMRVKAIALHEHYVPTQFYNDIAMLTLEDEILSPYVSHICLPSHRIASIDMDGLNTTLLGWKDTSHEGNSTSELYIVDNIPVVSNERCRSAYRTLPAGGGLPQGITDDFICTGSDKGDIDDCQTDTGGPLMYKDNNENPWDFHPQIPWVLVGMVSFGFRCGEPGYPDVYTRVASHMDWISEQMKD